MKLQKLLIPSVVVAVLGGGGWAAWHFLAPAAEDPTAGRAVTVRRGELVEVAAASGTIQPHVQVEVKSRASGEVIEVNVQEGQQVHAGDLLFRLDPTDAERDVTSARVALRRVQAQLGQQNASLGVARAEAADAMTTSDVNRRGAELGVISAETSRSATHAAAVANANIRLHQSQVAASSADLAAARLAVDEAERRLTETSIFAPISGTVLAVNVERGSIVASGITSVSGGTALATVADLTDLRVIGAIDEAQIGRVHVDQPVKIRVDAYPERAFEGHVSRVSPLGTTASNVVTFDVEIIVTDAHASLLRSGMSADVEIETSRSANTLLVPLLAIQSVGERRFVRLAGTGERRAIRTGQTDGSRIAVLGGLAEGDRVLLAPAGGRGGPAAAASKSLIPMGGPRRPGGGGGAGGFR